MVRTTRVTLFSNRPLREKNLSHLLAVAVVDFGYESCFVGPREVEFAERGAHLLRRNYFCILEKETGVVVHTNPLRLAGYRIFYGFECQGRSISHLGAAVPALLIELKGHVLGFQTIGKGGDYDFKGTLSLPVSICINASL